MKSQQPIIEMNHVGLKLGNVEVHRGIHLTIFKGEIIAIVGGSGSGKTTLLREMLMLTPPDTGSIHMFGQDMTHASPELLLEAQRRLGVLFQQNALFSSLTVLENVSFPLREHTQLDHRSMARLALLKILMTGLPSQTADKYPAELSGGMQKRAALARAIVLDPEALFLDEPTAGLDPVSAAGLDELVLNLKRIMGLTVVMVTHDIDTLWRITDRVAFLGEGKVLRVDKVERLAEDPHPLIQEFFKGPRGRGAAAHYRQ